LANLAARGLVGADKFVIFVSGEHVAQSVAGPVTLVVEIPTKACFGTVVDAVMGELPCVTRLADLFRLRVERETTEVGQDIGLAFGCIYITLIALVATFEVVVALRLDVRNINVGNERIRVRLCWIFGGGAR